MSSLVNFGAAVQKCVLRCAAFFMERSQAKIPVVLSNGLASASLILTGVMFVDVFKNEYIFQLIISDL